MMFVSGARRSGELALPGAMVGAFAGLFAGLLGLFGGQPLGWDVATTFTLSIPTAVLGAGYSLALAHRLFRPGVFAPAALYWFVGFPLARLVHEVSVQLLLTGRASLSEGVLAFLVFQSLVSVGFAIGFVWAHERIMPPWLLTIQGRNDKADRLLVDYVGLAERADRRKPADGR